MGNPTHHKFQKEEFACRCGCGKGFEDMRAETLSKLYKARDIAGVPMQITSAYRCEAHNAKVGGGKNSAHLRGRAVDIKFRGMADDYEILRALFAAGFPRIGINFQIGFIHADDDPTLPRGLFKY